MISGFLDLAHLLQNGNFQVTGDRLVSAPGDTICKFLGSGVLLHQIQDIINATVVHPMFTQAVLVTPNILVSHLNITTLVSLKQFTGLLEVLGFENQIDLQGDRSLVYISEGGRKIVTNFRASDSNTCLAMPEVTNLHHQLVRLTSEMAQAWNQLLIDNQLYGEIINMACFMACCEMQTNSFYELLEVTPELF